MVRSFPNSSLVAYPTKGKLAAFPVPAQNQVYVFNARATNNSGAAQNVGILQLLTSKETSLWNYVNVGPVYTSIGAAVSAGTASVLFAGAANDGFVAQARSKFGMVGFTVSTASAGGTFTYKYWNGTIFTTLTTLEVPATYAAAGDNWIVFQPPQDWVKGGPSQIDQDKYSIFVQSTVAPAGAVSVNFMWIGAFLDFYEGVPNNAAVQMSYPDSKPYLLNGGEGLVPYFSVPAAANQFGCYFALV
jgi:hypothetical protein